jgi:hypothetical protein
MMEILNKKQSFKEGKKSRNQPYRKRREKV